MLAKSDDADNKLALLRKLADVTGHKLSDKQTALSYARKAYDFDPRAEGALKLLEEYARAAGNWEPFVSAIEARLQREKDMATDEHRVLQVRLAEVYAIELGRVEEAIKTYRALVEEQPDDAFAITTLDRILRSANRRDDLRWLFELRVQRVEGEQAVALLLEWATLEEEVFQDPQRAIETYRRALKLDKSNETALTNLPRLLIEAGDIAAAIKIIEAHCKRSEQAVKASLELQLAELHTRLQRYGKALDACVRALDHGGDADRAIGVLEGLMQAEDTRARAAEVLVDVHRPDPAHLHRLPLARRNV